MSWVIIPDVIEMERPFEGLLGNTCEMRLIEFLLPLEGISFNITELTEEAGISRVTVGKIVKKFVTWNVLKTHPGRNTEYSINNDSPIVRSINVMNNALIAEMLGEDKLQEVEDSIVKSGYGAGISEMEFSTENFSGGYYEGFSNSNPIAVDPSFFASAEGVAETEQIGYFR